MKKILNSRKNKRIVLILLTILLIMIGSLFVWLLNNDFLGLWHCDIVYKYNGNIITKDDLSLDIKLFRTFNYNDGKKEYKGRYYIKDNKLTMNINSKEITLYKEDDKLCINDVDCNKVFFNLIDNKTIEINIEGDISSKFERISYDQFNNLFKTNETEFVYIYSNGCHYCHEMYPNLALIQDKKEINIKALDSDSLNEKQRESIKKIADLKQFDGLPTPTVLIIENGQIVDTQLGYDIYDSIESFFEKNGF